MLEGDRLLKPGNLSPVFSNLAQSSHRPLVKRVLSVGSIRCKHCHGQVRVPFLPGIFVLVENLSKNSPGFRGRVYQSSPLS